MFFAEIVEYSLYLVFPKIIDLAVVRTAIRYA